MSDEIMGRLKIFVFVLVMAAVSDPAWSPQANGASNNNQGTNISPGVYTQDRYTMQLVAGALFATDLIYSTPTFNYAQTSLRLGWMVNSPPPSPSFFRGNFELLAELSYATVFNGFGNYLMGGGGLLRYNFLQPDARLIPYLQFGAGFVYTDAHEDKTQDAIGQAIEFTLQGSFGARYLIKKNWSIDAEATYHHISNAGIADRNRGINAFGAFFGVTYFTNWFWK